MSSSETVAVGQSTYRTIIFVDFWNYSLSMRELEDNFPTDWKVLPHVIVKEAVKVVDPTGRGIYHSMRVYGSFDQNGDANLKKWATTVLDTFPGVKVNFVPRQRKHTGPKCPHCHTIVEHCPQCGKDMRGTEEKGVDTAIAVDMISLAWEGAYDVAVLVSADRDFVPVAEFLATKGIKVIHGAFSPKGAVLSQKSWGKIDLPRFREDYRRPRK
jgi:uncharacterized LabA/DUF88 family protein